MAAPAKARSVVFDEVLQCGVNVKPRSLLGESGNKWIDEAWFTIAINDATLSDSAITVENTYQIKEEFSKVRSGYYERDLIARLREIRNAIEDKTALFVMAFPRIIDVFALLSWHGKAEYKPYSKPQNWKEHSIHHLFEAFPMRSNDKVDVVIFAGNGELPIPQLGADTGGPGSIQNIAGYERMPGVKRRHIRHLGFLYGLWMVQVTYGTPLYRFAKSEIWTLWDEAAGKANIIDRQNLTPTLESLLLKLVRGRFGTPGKTV